MIDLVGVQYDTKGANKEVCVAPYASVAVGDKVQTEWGTGTVKSVVHIHAGDDDRKMFTEEFGMKSVLYVLLPLKWDD